MSSTPQQPAQGEPPLVKVLRDICADPGTTWPWPLDQNEAIAWRDYIDRLSAENSARVWQPIETAPKDGTRILVYCPDEDLISGYAIAVAWWDEGQPHVSFHPTESPELWKREVTTIGRFVVEGEWYFPTKWQPLPAPPTQQTAQPEDGTK